MPGSVNSAPNPNLLFVSTPASLSKSGGDDAAVEICEKLRPHSTFADKAATNQHNSGGWRRPLQKTPKLAIFGGGERGKKGGRREWTWVAFQWAERDEVEMEEGREAKRSGGEPPSLPHTNHGNLAVGGMSRSLFFHPLAHPVAPCATIRASTATKTEEA